MRRLDEDLRTLAEAWLEEGLSPRTIAYKIGCSTRTIQRIQRRLYDETTPTAEGDRDEDLVEKTKPGRGDVSRANRSRRVKRSQDASPWGLIIPLAVVAYGCFVFVRRRWRDTLSIGDGAAGTDGMSLPPLTGRAVAASGPPAYKTPLRRPRTYETVAPYPGDDAIFGADPAPDEIWDPGLAARPNAYKTFAAFSGLFDFYPDSDN
ncbi:MAG: helix-turn-helix domain-containing protein [Candidatus Cybelea sp.]